MTPPTLLEAAKRVLAKYESVGFPKATVADTIEAIDDEMGALKGAIEREEETYVIDASMGTPFCYCPVELDSNGDVSAVITGMNVIGYCPGKLIGVWHPDGPAAAEKWAKENPDWRKQ